MTDRKPPWDQQVARILVRPLVNTPVTPNQITAFSLLLALAGAALFAVGGSPAVHWGAGLLIAGRFIDHMDGELARATGKGSRFGHVFDAVTGSLSYGALFVGIGIGLWRQGEPDWIPVLGIVASLPIFVNMIYQFRAEHAMGEAPDMYPRFGPFELEDGVYLIGPIVWLGGLYEFFLLGCAGTLIACAVGIVKSLRQIGARS
jgi:phosphatidylglycerophosphate synthase